MKTAAMRIQTIYPDGEPAPGVPLEIRYPGNKIETGTGSGGIVQLEDIPLETVVEVRVKQQRQGDIEKQFTCTGMGQYPPIVVEDMHENEVVPPPPPPPPTQFPGPESTEDKGSIKRFLIWLLVSLSISIILYVLLSSSCGQKQPVPTPMAITVSDAETGKPIEGAGVIVSYDGKRIDRQTDARGVVEYRDLPVGNNLKVFVAARGYEEKSETLPCCTDREYRLKPLVLRGQTGELRINLRWYNCADLDLYVQPPCGPEIYWKNNFQCGGKLDQDANRACKENINCQAPQENVYWQKAPPGKYVIFVELFDPCGISGEIDFTVRTEIKGQAKDYPGRVTVKKEKVTVTEFTIKDD